MDVSEKKLFCKGLVYETSLSRREAERRVSELIKQDICFKVGTVKFSAQPYIGRLCDGKFRMYRSLGFRRVPLPAIVYGEIQERKMGKRTVTKIVVQIKPDGYTLVISSVILIGAVGVFVYSLFTAIRIAQFDLAIIGIVAVIGFLLLLIIGSFKHECGFAERTLNKLFEK